MIANNATGSVKGSGTQQQGQVLEYPRVTKQVGSGTQPMRNPYETRTHPSGAEQSRTAR